MVAAAHAAPTLPLCLVAVGAVFAVWYAVDHRESDSYQLQ
jgi:hypothetical protein